jgi:hypothetical protein
MMVVMMAAMMMMPAVMMVVTPVVMVMTPAMVVTIAPIMMMHMTWGDGARLDDFGLGNQWRCDESRQ